MKCLLMITIAVYFFVAVFADSDQYSSDDDVVVALLLQPNEVSKLSNLLSLQRSKREEAAVGAGVEVSARWGGRRHRNKNQDKSDNGGQFSSFPIGFGGGIPNGGSGSFSSSQSQSWSSGGLTGSQSQSSSGGFGTGGSGSSSGSSANSQSSAHGGLSESKSGAQSHAQGGADGSSSGADSSASAKGGFVFPE